MEPPPRPRLSLSRRRRRLGRAPRRPPARRPAGRRHSPEPPPPAPSARPLSLAAQRKHGGGQGVSRPAPSLRPQVSASVAASARRESPRPEGPGPPGAAPGEKEAPGPAGPLPPPLGPYCPSVCPDRSACQRSERGCRPPTQRSWNPRGVLHPRPVRRGPVSGPRPSLNRGTPGLREGKTQGHGDSGGSASRAIRAGGRCVQASGAGSAGECWFWAEGQELKELSVCSDWRAERCLWILAGRIRFGAGEDRGRRASWPR
ncbi:unnamed protein product [Rangifer tarandus platyrhynchus]|uniref:Basic proline-rich protein-like n=1 Tax=Rangifer tarandus platyrhynchus TaxID=3082113 RepID=A0ABN8XSK0_RANTA|nr:unnamed protein product [Rangifer tarandus platyrhynchus]